MGFSYSSTSTGSGLSPSSHVQENDSIAISGAHRTTQHDDKDKAENKTAIKPALGCASCKVDSHFSTRSASPPYVVTVIR